MLVVDGCRWRGGPNLQPGAVRSWKVLRGAAMKASEYGGSDTSAAHGVQPFPHVLQPHEELRLTYATDPAEPDGIPDPTTGA